MGWGHQRHTHNLQKTFRYEHRRAATRENDPDRCKCDQMGKHASPIGATTEVVPPTQAASHPVTNLGLRSHTHVAQVQTHTDTQMHAYTHTRTKRHDQATQISDRQLKASRHRLQPATAPPSTLRPRTETRPVLKTSCTAQPARPTHRVIWSV